MARSKKKASKSRRTEHFVLDIKGEFEQDHSSFTGVVSALSACVSNCVDDSYFYEDFLALYQSKKYEAEAKMTVTEALKRAKIIQITTVETTVPIDDKTRSRLEAQCVKYLKKACKEADDEKSHMSSLAKNDEKLQEAHDRKLLNQLIEKYGIPYEFAV